MFQPGILLDIIQCSDSNFKQLYNGQIRTLTRVRNQGGIKQFQQSILTSKILIILDYQQLIYYFYYCIYHLQLHFILFLTLIQYFFLIFTLILTYLSQHLLTTQHYQLVRANYLQTLLHLLKNQTSLSLFQHQFKYQVIHHKHQLSHSTVTPQQTAPSVKRPANYYKRLEQLKNKQTIQEPIPLFEPENEKAELQRLRKLCEFQQNRIKFLEKKLIVKIRGDQEPEMDSEEEKEKYSQIRKKQQLQEVEIVNTTEQCTQTEAENKQCVEEERVYTNIKSIWDIPDQDTMFMKRIQW
ncbi:Hypothetical_protein [Hexamita inflata]|uniref:Hypothetical_protein n=1 Tax=Hexamita inflata TaxID=28002 RepID=A0ABP1GSG8_9EUKA